MQKPIRLALRLPLFPIVNSGDIYSLSSVYEIAQTLGALTAKAVPPTKWLRQDGGRLLARYSARYGIRKKDWVEGNFGCKAVVEAYLKAISRGLVALDIRGHYCITKARMIRLSFNRWKKEQRKKRFVIQLDMRSKKAGQRAILRVQ